MKKSIEHSNSIVDIFQYIFMVIGIFPLTVLFLKVDTQINLSTEKYFIIILILYIFFKFILDLFTFGPGLTSYSLLFLFTPVVSLLIYGPKNEVATIFNANTGLINEHFHTILFGCIYFYYVWSYLFYFSQKKFKKFDMEIIPLFKQIKGNNLSTYFFAVIALLASIIYKPTIPGQSYISLREVDPLIPGSGWNLVVVMAYFFTLIGNEKNIVRNIVLVIVPVWLIINYARVDIMGIFLFYLLFTIYRRKLYLKNNWFMDKNIAGKFLVLGIIVIVFSYIGIVRNEGFHLSSDSLLRALSLTFNYPTVQDLIYSFAATVEVEDLFGTTSTIFWYFIKVIPSYFIAFPEDASKYVQSMIFTNYGMHISSEFYLNFGVWGIIISPFMFYIMIFAPMKVMKKLFGPLGITISYYLLVMSTSRIYWYGYIYYIKPYFTIIPIFIVIHLFLCSIEKKLIMKYRL